MPTTNLYRIQPPTVERALCVASRMAGTEKSRGYCQELVWADFLAGRTEESSPEENLLMIERLVKVLPEAYQSRLIGMPNGEAELATVKSH